MDTIFINSGKSKIFDPHRLTQCFRQIRLKRKCCSIKSYY